MQLNWIFSQSIGFCYLKTNGFAKDATRFASMARSTVSKLFWARPNLSLVNISRPKPQTTYEKMIVWMNLGSKLLSSFLMSTIYSFLKCPRYVDRHRQAVVTLKIQLIHNPGLDHLCATHFLTLLYPSLCFDPHFGNHWAKSTYQPWC